MDSKTTLVACCALIWAAVAAIPASAETIALKADLSAANQVPPANSRGAGSAEVTYDTESKLLSWTVTYSGMTSPPTAAHFHGPAAPGENAPIVVPLTQLTSPATGTATLDDTQAADLLAGRLYLNFHTPAFPGGEIRGQVVRVSP